MLSQADVERLACEVWDWRRQLDEPDSYWLTGQHAGDMLGVTRQNLDRLSRLDRVPFVWHRDGVRLYRRAQLETVANSRDARWH